MRPQIPLTLARPFGLLGAWIGVDDAGMAEHEYPGEFVSDGPGAARLFAGDRPNATRSTCVVPFIRGEGGPATAPGRGYEERTLRRHIYLECQALAVETAGRNRGIAETPCRCCPVVLPLCSAALSRWRSDR
jgi:hypothetical protein